MDDVKPISAKEARKVIADLLRRMHANPMFATEATTYGGAIVRSAYLAAVDKLLDAADQLKIVGDN